MTWKIIKKIGGSMGIYFNPDEKREWKMKKGKKADIEIKEVKK